MAGKDFPNNQNLGIVRKVEVPDQTPDLKMRIVYLKFEPVLQASD
jgi:hypothetical protein